jgi:uncharacterized protein YlxP (DUF503 family)
VSDSAFVALLLVHIVIPDAGSLKAKRAVLNRTKALLRERLGASVAEVGHQDAWQRSTLAVAVAAGSAGRAEEAADRIERALDARFPAGVRVERRVVSWSDLEAVG